MWKEKIVVGLYQGFEGVAKYVALVGKVSVGAPVYVGSFMRRAFDGVDLEAGGYFECFEIGVAMETERVKLDVSVLQKPAITVRLEPCAKPFVSPEGAVKVPPLADLIFNYKLGVL